MQVTPDNAAGIALQTGSVFAVFKISSWADLSALVVIGYTLTLWGWLWWRIFWRPLFEDKGWMKPKKKRTRRKADPESDTEAGILGP